MIGRTERLEVVSRDLVTGEVGKRRFQKETAGSKIDAPDALCSSPLHESHVNPTAQGANVQMTNSADTSQSAPDRSRAYLYVYTSQTRSPEVAEQVLAGRRLAESEGYTVVKTEIDGGRNSSSLSERDGLRRLLAAAGERKFDALILQDTSCLPPNPMDLFAVLTQLCIHGLEIRSVAEGLVDTQALMRVAADTIWEGREQRASGADRLDWINKNE